MWVEYGGFKVWVAGSTEYYAFGGVGHVGH